MLVEIFQPILADHDLSVAYSYADNNYLSSITDSDYNPVDYVTEVKPSYSPAALPPRCLPVDTGACNNVDIDIAVAGNAGRSTQTTEAASQADTVEGDRLDTAAVDVGVVETAVTAIDADVSGREKGKKGKKGKKREGEKGEGDKGGGDKRGGEKVREGHRKRHKSRNRPRSSPPNEKKAQILRQVYKSLFESDDSDDGGDFGFSNGGGGDSDEGEQGRLKRRRDESLPVVMGNGGGRSRVGKTGDGPLAIAAATSLRTEAALGPIRSAGTDPWATRTQGLIRTSATTQEPIRSTRTDSWATRTQGPIRTSGTTQGPIRTPEKMQAPIRAQEPIRTSGTTPGPIRTSESTQGQIRTQQLAPPDSDILYSEMEDALMTGRLRGGRRVSTVEILKFRMMLAERDRDDGKC